MNKIINAIKTEKIRALKPTLLAQLCYDLSGAASYSNLSYHEFVTNNLTQLNYLEGLLPFVTARSENLSLCRLTEERTVEICQLLAERLNWNLESVQ